MSSSYFPFSFSSPYNAPVTNGRILQRSTALPFSLGHLKQFLRVANPESPREDLVITGIAKGAVDLFTSLYGRSVLRTTWQQTVDSPRTLSASQIRLISGDILQISSVELADTDNTWTTADPTSYYTAGLYLIPNIGYWPRSRGTQGLRITFDAGYGDTADTVPDGLKQGLMMLIANMYEHRADEDQRATGIEGFLVKDIPWGAKQLLSPYRIWSI